MSFWSDRSPSEKKMLTILSAVVIFAGLGQALWLAYHETLKLRKEVPALKSQVEDMKAKAEEWHSLSSKPEKKANLANLRSEVQAQLTHLGSAIKIEWKGQSQFSLSGKTSFASLMRVLGEFHENLSIIVTQAKITREAQGSVNVEIELAAN